VPALQRRPNHATPLPRQPCPQPVPQLRLSAPPPSPSHHPSTPGPPRARVGTIMPHTSRLRWWWRGQPAHAAPPMPVLAPSPLLQRRGSWLEATAETVRGARCRSGLRAFVLTRHADHGILLLESSKVRKGGRYFQVLPLLPSRVSQLDRGDIKTLGKGNRQRFPPRAYPGT
jgi:hypothetical protein